MLILSIKTAFKQSSTFHVSLKHAIEKTSNSNYVPILKKLLLILQILLLLGNTSGSSECRVSHQILVDLPGSLSTLMDGPDDQTLAATTISSGVDLRNARAILAHRSVNIRARVLLHIQLVQQVFFWTQEAHGQQNQVALVDLLSAWQLMQLEASIGVPSPLDLHSVDSLHISIAVVDKALGRDLEDSRVLAQQVERLLVAIVELEHLGPCWPWIVLGTAVWWTWQDFKGGHVDGSLAERGAYAVNASVTASDDQDLLALGHLQQIVHVLLLALGVGSLLLLPALQEAHGEVNAVQLASLRTKK